MSACAERLVFRETSCPGSGSESGPLSVPLSVRDPRRFDVAHSRINTLIELFQILDPMSACGDIILAVPEREG